MTTAITAVRTVQEQVVDNLRRLILEGDFAPGDKLQQEELAALLGVSAMPVREGLRRLQAEGAVRDSIRHANGRWTLKSVSGIPEN